MDNDHKEFEELLKEFTPKELSHGARWNLAQRLNDMEYLEAAKKTQSPQPRLLLMLSTAASILFAVIIWAVVTTTDETNGTNPPEPLVTGDKKPTPETIVVDPTLVVEQDGPVFVKNEKGVPTKVPASLFDMRQHVTDMQDMGVVRMPNRPPMRRVRREFINEYKVKDPDSGKTYKIHKPGSDTILIKIRDY